MVHPITDSSARTQLINRSLADFPGSLLEESKQEECTRKTTKKNNPKTECYGSPFLPENLKKKSSSGIKIIKLMPLK